jgi:acetoacetyl-CoA synthetase
MDTVFAANNPLGPAYTIVDCLAVGQSIASGTDERVILFVKLLDGYDLSEELQTKIRAEIRTRRSPRHVPAKVSWLHQSLDLLIR